MTYKEIIDKNIKEFDEKFPFLNQVKFKSFFGQNYDEVKTLNNIYTNLGDKIKYEYKQFLISFLEEENKRLDDIHKQFPENETVLEDIFKNTENMNRVYARVGYRKALNDQIAHNKEIISYLKEM